MATLEKTYISSGYGVPAIVLDEDDCMIESLELCIQDPGALCTTLYFRFGKAGRELAASVSAPIVTPRCLRPKGGSVYIRTDQNRVILEDCVVNWRVPDRLTPDRLTPHST